MAVAEASLRISMLAISFGLMEVRAFWLSCPVDPIGLDTSWDAGFRMIPSTTYSGSLEPLKELVPRILMLTAPPGALVPVVTCTPAARPCSNLSKEVDWAACTSSILTEETEPVMSLFLTVP